MVGEHEAPGGGAHSRSRERVLDRERHAREWPGIVAARDERVDPDRGLPGFRGRNGDNRVGRVPIDAVERGGDDRVRGDTSAPNRGRDRRRVSIDIRSVNPRHTRTKPHRAHLMPTTNTLKGNQQTPAILYE